MSEALRALIVSEDESELRLDRWFKRHFPTLSHGRLERLIRTGQVRVDGRRAKSGLRLAPGQSVRVPQLGESGPQAEGAGARPRLPPTLSDADRQFARALVLYRDDDVIALNKPPGLAVQGGTGLARHLDGLLDALRFDAPERPRLVHRLDKDTSGVLLLGRNAKAAARLAAAFRDRATRKIYWALTAGVPRPFRGRIDLALAKQGEGAERMTLDEEDGKRAVTYYAVVEHMGRKAAWLALWPVTGRTHQLRVHLAAIGTPILGDGKYGAAQAFAIPGLSGKLHLHARAIAIPHPSSGKPLTLMAPLPPHMLESWRYFGFDPEMTGDPFAELETK